MAEYPYLPFWTDAYLADTTHLTTQQHGALILMLATAWRDPDCCLQNDDRYLARITRMSPAAWRRNASVLRAFWQVRDGFLYQKRLSRERQKVEERSTKGKRAAEARWRKSNESVDASASGEQSAADTSRSKSIPRSKEKNSESSGEEKGAPGKVGSLKSITYERARELAPGWDVYALEQRWRDWSTNEVIRDSDAAFLAFVKKHAATNNLY